MKRMHRVLLLVAISVPLLVAMALPAFATITPNNACTGNGQFTPGGFKDAASAEITIPQKARVAWAGTVIRPAPQQPRAVDGFVALELPMGQKVTLGTWPSTGVLVANNGVYEYELPSVIAGFDMTFFGEHKEEGNLWCSGRVTVRVEGNNPLGIPSVALFVISVVGVSLSITASGGAQTDIHEIKPGEPYDV